MSSKWCPKCGRINSVIGWTPRYCMWGCGSLADMPVLPPIEKWDCDYYEMVERCRKEWENKQTEKTKTSPEPEYIGEGMLQMKLF